MKSTAEMHIDYGVDHFVRHVCERFIAQDSRVVNDNVDASKLSNSVRDDRSAACGSVYRVGVGDSDAACSSHFSRDALRWSIACPRAIERTANVVTKQLRAPRGE